MVKVNHYVQKSLSLSIALYRNLISPILGQHCRFYPSCSVYAQAAIEEHGSIYGISMALKRILCCHPWHAGGFDPVPTKQKSSIEN